MAIDWSSLMLLYPFTESDIEIFILELFGVELYALANEFELSTVLVAVSVYRNLNRARIQQEEASSSSGHGRNEGRKSSVNVDDPRSKGIQEIGGKEEEHEEVRRINGEQELMENFKDLEINATQTMGKRLSGRMKNKNQQKTWRIKRQKSVKMSKIVKKTQKTGRKDGRKKKMFVDMAEMKIKNRLEMFEYCSGSPNDEQESIKNHEEQKETEIVATKNHEEQKDTENVANHDEEADDSVYGIPFLIDQAMENKKLEKPKRKRK